MDRLRILLMELKIHIIRVPIKLSDSGGLLSLLKMAKTMHSPLQELGLRVSLVVKMMAALTIWHLQQLKLMGNCESSHHQHLIIGGKSTALIHFCMGPTLKSSPQETPNYRLVQLKFTEFMIPLLLALKCVSYSKIE